ncbi:MAG: cell division protein FtsK [Pseudonocardiaceae bacterium]|nr:cell division protein FtsK [Pseudonocardiaceae bacterium]
MSTTDHTTPDQPGHPGNGLGPDEAARVDDVPASHPGSTGPPPAAPHPTPPGPGAVVEGEVVATDHTDDGDGERVESGETGARVRVDSPDAAEPGLLDRIRADRHRPVLPAWARSRAELVTTGRWVSAHYAHVAGYHALRTPKYATTLGLRAPVGATRAVTGATRWVFDFEGLPVRHAAVRREDAELYLRLSRQRDMRVRLRALLAIPALLAAVIVAVAGWHATPGWAHVLALAALAAVAGAFGAPADRRGVLDTAVVSTKAAKLTSEIVTRALLSLNIAQINQTVSKGGGVTFPAPIVRDGPGWRAEVDLPFGVTATDVLERRDKLASGLRRPLGCVWPEPAHAEHTGRLVLWVGDQDMSQAKPITWPLAKHGSADLFKPVTFGTDPRNRPVDVQLMFNNVLIGAMPRFGKTFAMRVLLLAAALDPSAELRCFEFKGTGDLEAAEKVAHHYASGVDDDTLASCVASLEEVHTDLARRARVIQGLPKTVCPENKVTPQLAARADLRLHPLVVYIDECQELFSHKTHGARAGELCEAIIKRGPALGVVLVLATQRPDKDSLPTAVSANVGIRLCLRVMGQVENDMVLGTSAYRNGIRATTFTARDKGIGYLVGVADDPQIVRSCFIDRPTADRIGDRARGLRDAAGTLTGHAAGLDTRTATTGGPGSDTLLSDILAVVPADEERVWSENVVARLAAHRPETYAGWKAEQLAAALRPHGVRTGQVWGLPDGGGRQANRRGIDRAHVTAAHTDSNRTGGGG